MSVDYQYISPSRQNMSYGPPLIVSAPSDLSTTAHTRITQGHIPLISPKRNLRCHAAASQALAFRFLSHLYHLLLVLPLPAVRVRDKTTQSHSHNEARQYSTTTRENSRSVYADACASASFSLTSPPLSARCGMHDSAPFSSKHRSIISANKRRPLSLTRRDQPRSNAHDFIPGCVASGR